ncbi:MAG: 50S ribosomal protein L15 [Bdellovibrionaceae bacterium]|nr:50S ribosomal protein L15 [Pseudobdellovibrionaceae bacterium]MBX3032412.1 50S ribosomal protein L15 [Pseudobdellovibrionaceae bacterium]
MSILSQLSPKEGSTHYRKRVGRGIGSGLGGYSGKGGKGQTQRSGGSIRRGFEGGQTPLHRRLPKFGFTNVAFASTHEIVNIGQLDALSGEINPETLKKAGLIHGTRIKVLAKGEIKKSHTVKAHMFSEAAKKAIEAAGGKVEILK